MVDQDPTGQPSQYLLEMASASVLQGWNGLRGSSSQTLQYLVGREKGAPSAHLNAEQECSIGLNATVSTACSAMTSFIVLGEGLLCPKGSVLHCIPLRSPLTRE